LSFYGAVEKFLAESNNKKGRLFGGLFVVAAVIHERGISSLVVWNTAYLTATSKILPSPSA
jgi:hypothetical protein